MSSRTLTTVLLLAAGLAAEGAAAQEVALCPAADVPIDSTQREPVLVIRASARAEEVRFRSEPRIEIRLTGCSVLDTVRVLERRNLPEPVQPNVTYRDVFVSVEILGYLDVECLLPRLTMAPQPTARTAAGARAELALARLCGHEPGDSTHQPSQRR